MTAHGAQSKRGVLGHHNGHGHEDFCFILGEMLVGGVNSGGWDGLGRIGGWRRTINDCMTREGCYIPEGKGELFFILGGTSLTGRKGRVKEGMPPDLGCRCRCIAKEFFHCVRNISIEHV